MAHRQEMLQLSPLVTALSLFSLFLNTAPRLGAPAQVLCLGAQPSSDHTWHSTGAQFGVPITVSHGLL